MGQFRYEYECVALIGDVLVWTDTWTGGLACMRTDDCVCNRPEAVDAVMLRPL